MQNKMLNLLKSNCYTLFWILNPNRSVEITFSSIINYFQAQYRLSKSFSKLPVHVREQIIYRESVSKCKDLEFCTACGCPTGELFYGDSGCKATNPCFPKMLNKQEWNKFINNEINLHK